MPNLKPYLLGLLLVNIVRVGFAQPKDPRNIVNGNPIYESGYVDQPYVVVLRDGRWLCLFTTGGGREGSDGQHPVAVVSENQGQTWSLPVAIEPKNGPPASWVTPYQTTYGRIYAFYDYNGDNITTLNGAVIRNDMLGWYCFRFSDDAGQTWSKRYRLPVRKTLADLNNDWKGEVQIMWGIAKPFRSNGFMYLPFTKLGKYMLEMGEGWVFKSDNIDTEKDPEKIHWNLLPEGENGIRNAAFGSVQEEHNIVALNNGDLYCAYRTAQGFIADSYSRNEGKSWSLPQKAVYDADKQPIKNPRACPKLFKCSNGRYLLWYHNHSGKDFASRNPAWLCGGIEKDGVIQWSQPEILLYGSDTTYRNGRMSYPDLIEQNGKYWITETQKIIARVHPIDPALLNGLWKQTEEKALVKNGLIFSKREIKSTQKFRLPSITNFKKQGLSIELWLSINDIEANQVVLDNFNHEGKGFRIGVTNHKTLQLTLSDGIQRAECETDEGRIRSGKLHHITFMIDGASKIITIEIDGKLCDGGNNKQYGWVRFSENLLDIGGNAHLHFSSTLNGKIQELRIYDRYLRTSESITNYQATKNRNSRK